MTDWREGLARALHSGNAAYMKAMLRGVPHDMLQQTVPYIATLAQSASEKDDAAHALAFYDQLVEIDAHNARWHVARAELKLKHGDAAAALVDARRASELAPDDERGLALQGDALAASGDRQRALSAYTAALALAPADPALQRKVAALSADAAPAPPPPDVAFDPALFADPALPPAADSPMVEGLLRHLGRYGYHQGVRNAIERISDAAWIAQWRAAFAGCSGESLAFFGSELGVLPLLALEAGAARVTIVATNPLERRIAEGIVQKHRLLRWRESVGAEFATLDPARRQASFEAYTADVAFVDVEQLHTLDCDRIVFPALDHTLLGTGLVPALARCREAGLVPRRGTLPSRLRLHVQGIEWRYPDVPLDLSALAEFRWSAYPETLPEPAAQRRALTADTVVADIEPWNFAPATLRHVLDVTAGGRLDAIAFWFDVELGAAGFTTAADAAATSDRASLACLRPAVQYLDPAPVEQGARIALDVTLEPTRLVIERSERRSRVRSARLPGWYVPMMLDTARNAAYRAALGTVAPDTLVLELGAGCGLLSLLAADAGANAVVGCEIDRHICRVGNDVVAGNGGAGRVTLVQKDCRTLAVGTDLPRRADLVLFELFDCGLIGEGILHFLAHVREHLASANARYLPLSARVRGMLVESRLERVAGIDVNLLNPFCFTPGYSNVDAQRLNYRALGAPFDVFAFDFASATPAPQEIKLDLEATADGVAGAVLFWFDLQLDADTWLSNAPDASQRLHWGQALQYLPEVRVLAGMRTPLVARHQGSAISFGWFDAELPQKAYSRLPRVDPTMWAQAMELENQTQQLLRHCRANPAEYARVAELAQRIAIDPGRSGIEPKVAQRFAGLFA